MAKENIIWEPCSEENYPELDEVCLVRFKSSANDGFYEFHILSDCPFGWNVLMRLGADCIKFKK